MSVKDDFTPVFSKLKRLLQKHASRLTVKSDKPGNYYLDQEGLA